MLIDGVNWEGIERRLQLFHQIMKNHRQERYKMWASSLNNWKAPMAKKKKLLDVVDGELDGNGNIPPALQEQNYVLCYTGMVSLILMQER